MAPSPLMRRPWEDSPADHPAPDGAILVVEDDPLMRLSTCAVLEEAGCSPVEAGSADAALIILESRNDIKIVVSDIQMPGSIDGLRLARAIRDRWPDIEVVLTSGRLTPSRDQLPQRVRYLPKPFARSELLNEIRQLAAEG